MKKNLDKVAIIKCNSYNQEEIDRAIKKILKLLNFPTTKYKNILIKPNIIGYFKENLDAIITHPSIVKSLMGFFKNAKVGESSFSDTKDNLKNAGYWKFKPIIFEEQKSIEIIDKNAKVLKYFHLPKIVKEADLIINVSKLKTHLLTKITGAVKNLYGCIPGRIKQVYHRDAEGEEKFSKLLIDIYQNIKPELNIMDAVIAMEGGGPTAGKPKRTNLILASKNAIALDVVASKIMGYKPKDILTIKEAVKRNLGNYDVEIVGDFKKIPNLNFEKPSQFRRLMADMLLMGVTKEKITVDENKCIRCKICAEHCPMKAIALNPYPFVDKKKCIRCFCCIEVCPNHALYLKENIMRRIVNLVKKMIKKISRGL
jgi:uncharacterized protein (DUF362 family)/Pyruvate/2-oxoacid:ferredoxin oxidoreductase delta subunit